MLTRHSPPRAVGCAEAGWLVGESDGRSRPSMRPSDRPNFLSFPITVHNAGPGENRSPWCSLGSPARNKKSPRAGHPVSPGRRPRRVGSLSDPGGQAGFLLDRCGGQTPALSLESSTVAAHGQPQKRRTGHSMESHPVILRNLRTKSKKKFADCSVFSSSRPHSSTYVLGVASLCRLKRHSVPRLMWSQTPGGSGDHCPSQLVQGQLFTGTGRACGSKK